MSAIESLKDLLRVQLGIPPLVILALGGLVAHLALNMLLRKSSTSVTGLIAPLLLALCLESYEVWVHYRDVELFAAGNVPILAIIVRHSLDIAAMLMLPLLWVAAGWWRGSN